MIDDFCYMSYLRWAEQSIDLTKPADITKAYAAGFVFTRTQPNVMNQTRSIRINLNEFTLSSENRRILRKTDALSLHTLSLPLSSYDWQIGKMAKDFYDTKFAKGTFSANKIKEILSTPFSFNTLYQYNIDDATIGYAICYENTDIVHYSYPFYLLEADKNTGMGMMVRAITQAQQTQKKYMYLGSAQRPTDIYKLQFSGLEWFDGNDWVTDQSALKSLLLDLKSNE